MKNTIFLIFFVVIALVFVSCDSGTGNIQGEIKLNLIEHIEGKDLGGTTVKIKGRNETAATDKDGKFTLKNIEAGTYTLTISRDDWDTKEAEVKVEGGNIAELNETLDYSFGIVAGKLVNMPPKHTIALVQKENETVTYQQTTTSDFLMVKVKLGTYTVTITDADKGYLITSFELIVPKNWYHYFTDLNTDDYLDFDSDGIPNKTDPDWDNDSIENEMDCVNGTSDFIHLVVMCGNYFCAQRIDHQWTCKDFNTYKDWAGLSDESWNRNFSTTVSGNSHICGLENSKIWCWYDTVITSMTQTNSNDWSTLYAGKNRLCGVSQTDGFLYCWQDDLIADPIKVSEENWLSISLGNEKIWGIKTDGSLWNWTYGEATTTQVGTDQWISFSNDSLYVVKKDGTLWFFGDESLPLQLGSDADWKMVIGTCAVKTDNSTWCWDEITTTPAQNIGFGWSCGEWSFISRVNNPDVSQRYCGLKSDYSLWCWKDGVMTNIDSLPLN